MEKWKKIIANKLDNKRLKDKTFEIFAELKRSILSDSFDEIKEFLDGYGIKLEFQDLIFKDEVRVTAANGFNMFDLFFSASDGKIDIEATHYYLIPKITIPVKQIGDVRETLFYQIEMTGLTTTKFCEIFAKIFDQCQYFNDKDL